MISKFLRPLNYYVAPRFAAPALRLPSLAGKVLRLRQTDHRCYSDYIPPSQYDVPLTKKLCLGYAVRVYWEIIPLVICTMISIGIVFAAVFWAMAHKVDLVFTPHNLNSISRTMDLRSPQCHKMLTITQKYEPWPEMQAVLDKMSAAEKRALLRLQNCTHGNPD